MQVGQLASSAWVWAAHAASSASKLTTSIAAATRANFTIMAGGQPASAMLRLVYVDGAKELRASSGDIPAFTALRAACFQLGAGGARELKVMTHWITPEGDSVGLPGRLVVHAGDDQQAFDLTAPDGEIVLPLPEKLCR